MAQLIAFASATKAYLDSIHGGLFPLLLVAALWVTQWGVRRWVPQVWEAMANLPLRLGLETFDRGARKAWQAVPSVLSGAALTWLATGGSLADAVAGALLGLFAPLLHEALKALPGPYGSKR